VVCAKLTFEAVDGKFERPNGCSCVVNQHLISMSQQGIVEVRARFLHGLVAGRR
jgi:hypothetical protein